MEYIQLVNGFVEKYPWIILIVLAWTIPIKGIALWKSARLYHQYWFIFLLILNTFGILELIYIFFFARKAEKELPPIAEE